MPDRSFTGLDEENSDYLIELFAFIDGDKLIIKVRDNGVGMTKEELERIWTDKKKSKLAFNSIGLKDDDMMFSSVNIAEAMEFMFWLDEIG